MSTCKTEVEKSYCAREQATDWALESRWALAHPFSSNFKFSCCHVVFQLASPSKKSSSALVWNNCQCRTMPFCLTWSSLVCSPPCSLVDYSNIGWTLWMAHSCNRFISTVQNLILLHELFPYSDVILKRKGSKL
jgi:hypothetical protein